MRKWFWVLDTLVVLSFVVIGRDSHGFTNDWAETLRIAVPFLIGLAIAVVTVRAWLAPTSITTGLNLGALTLILGMLLRRFVWGDGTAPVFVIVTGAWLIGWMVAWRLVVLGLRRYRARTA